MLKIGIMGAGFIGAQHAASYKEIKDAQLVAILDSTERLVLAQVWLLPTTAMLRCLKRS